MKRRKLSYWLGEQAMQHLDPIILKYASEWMQQGLDIHTFELRMRDVLAQVVQFQNLLRNEDPSIHPNLNLDLNSWYTWTPTSNIRREQALKFEEDDDVAIIIDHDDYDQPYVRSVTFKDRLGYEVIPACLLYCYYDALMCENTKESCLHHLEMIQDSLIKAGLWEASKKRYDGLAKMVDTLPARQRKRVEIDVSSSIINDITDRFFNDSTWSSCAQEWEDKYSSLSEELRNSEYGKKCRLMAKAYYHDLPPIILCRWRNFDRVYGDYVN